MATSFICVHACVCGCVFVRSRLFTLPLFGTKYYGNRSLRFQCICQTLFFPFCSVFVNTMATSSLITCSFFVLMIGNFCNAYFRCTTIERQQFLSDETKRSGQTQHWMQTTENRLFVIKVVRNCFQQPLRSLIGHCLSTSLL